MSDRDEINADEQELLRALRALAREEERLIAPPQIETRLMRAWDATRGLSAGHRRVVVRPFLKVAAALIVAAASAGYWWSRNGVNPPSFPEQRDQPAMMTSWPSSDTLAWLDPEPGSLQIVHVRVASTTLAAQGYALDDPDGDGLIELEVIVGADGMARGVRVVPVSAPVY